MGESDFSDFGFRSTGKVDVMPVRVTRDFIMRGKSCAGGWTSDQMAILGFPGLKGWPQKGWIGRAEGKMLTDDEASRFVALKDTGVGSGKLKMIRDGANLTLDF